MPEFTSTQDEKLAELLVIVADALADERAAGATKINKLLFFAEFAHVRQTGRSISGAEYQRLPAGPAPRRLRPVRDLLIARGDARLEMEPYRGRTQHRLIPLRAPRWDLFDATETVAIEEMLEMYRSETGTALSNLSHEEPAWDLFEDGETIRFEMAFAATEPPGGAARAHAKELAEKYLGR